MKAVTSIKRPFFFFLSIFFQEAFTSKATKDCYVRLRLSVFLSLLSPYRICDIIQIYQTILYCKLYVGIYIYFFSYVHIYSQICIYKHVCIYVRNKNYSKLTHLTVSIIRHIYIQYFVHPLEYIKQVVNYHEKFCKFIIKINVENVSYQITKNFRRN